MGWKSRLSPEEPSPGYLVETTYSFAGTSSSEGIEADLGDFGEISLRFAPSGEAKTRTFGHLGKGCTGPRKIVRQPGTFAGTFRFEGEAGYTSLEATEASGSIGTTAFFLCSTFQHRLPPAGHHAKPPTYLDVATAHRRRVFSASLVGHGRRAGFAASSHENPWSGFDNSVGFGRGVAVDRHGRRTAPVKAA